LRLRSSVTAWPPVLVNNVGIFKPKSFLDIPDADWLRFFEVNVLSGVRVSRAYLPRMLERNWGRILIISASPTRAGRGVNRSSEARLSIASGQILVSLLTARRGGGSPPGHGGS
jgi:NAD(P)-dependent dehydrogenase (short-subunit alcohol dehydrogenase family)